MRCLMHVGIQLTSLVSDRTGARIDRSCRPIHHRFENQPLLINWPNSSFRSLFVIPAKAGIHEPTPHGKTAIERRGTTPRLVIGTKMPLRRFDCASESHQSSVSSFRRRPESRGVGRGECSAGACPPLGQRGAWQNPPCQFAVPSHNSSFSYLRVPAPAGMSDWYENALKRLLSTPANPYIRHSRGGGNPGEVRLAELPHTNKNPANLVSPCAPPFSSPLRDLHKAGGGTATQTGHLAGMRFR